ncbi:MAG: transcriptional regulator [Candidatus Taylorbacteria bacterium CG11_big_fil_rev_8_21_14_0_20_46_11]|uniref:Transcriptional regulator n=1 Tax=Candidatus Taylorbacteria bacterium CG11_big_fil_rev_8_21_14_0_20_46_11 TaxID=1975025 RepID=A0A2H0KAV1_9BACT|nr:MAG: transcriptional regulator [Candidatus Taylorbacteria bacterium CG11_big_fil_rev_8_21_14_0_20_46_11]
MGQINNKIKICRAEHNLTQEELAQKTGVTRQTIIAVEKNKYVPSLELAFKIAGAFKKKIEEVFFYH